MMQMVWKRSSHVYAADGHRIQVALDACDNGILFASKDWARPEHNNKPNFLGNLHLGTINLCT